MKKSGNIIKDKLEKHLFFALVAFAATIVGATYYVIDVMKLDDYKFEIEILDKRLIEKDNKIADLEKNLMISEQEKNIKQTKIDSLQKELKSCCKKTPPRVDPRIRKIKNLIAEGQSLKKKNVNSNSVHKEFIKWRADCIEIISSVPDLASILNDFKADTDLRNDNYPQIPEMTTNGIEHLGNLLGIITSK